MAASAADAESRLEPRPRSGEPPGTLSLSMPSLQDRLQSALGDSYRIERELGGGGMSPVFLAPEVRLRPQGGGERLAPPRGAPARARRVWAPKPLPPPPPPPPI